MQETEGYRGGYGPFRDAVATLSERGVFDSTEVSDFFTLVNSIESRDEMEIQFPPGVYFGGHMKVISEDTVMIAYSVDETVYSEQFKYVGDMADTEELALTVLIISARGVGAYAGKSETKEGVCEYFGQVTRVTESDSGDNRQQILNSTPQIRTEEPVNPNTDNDSDRGCTELVGESQAGRSVGRSSARRGNNWVKGIRRSDVGNGRSGTGTQKQQHLFRFIKQKKKTDNV